MRILYEDNHLLVVEKPPRMPVQSDNSQDTDLLTLLKADIKERYNKPGLVFLGMVHRLDRPAGGVMVFGRTTKAASRLSEQIRDRTFEKEYHAIVIGTPTEPKGTLRNFLRKNTRTNNVEVVAPGVTGAQEALLTFQVAAEKAGLTLLKIQLETGRSHQIRVQMAAMGTPLFGDMRYGAQENRAYMERLRQYRQRKLGLPADEPAADAAITPGEADMLAHAVEDFTQQDSGKDQENRAHGEIALWSYRLSLIHPTKKERMTFYCPPPLRFPFTLFDFEVK